MNSFEELQVSTSTYMVYFKPDTNLNLNYLWENLPTIESTKRVQKITDVEQEGTIVNMRFGKNQKGIFVECVKYFPNQITINISIPNKNINCFLFKDKIEVRGIRDKNDLYKTIINMNQNFKKINYPVPTITKIESVMINLNYKYPFKINRESLSRFLILRGFQSYYDPQFGSGTFIKIPYKSNDKKHQTMIVFQSGNVMHSGKCLSEMKEAYETIFPLILQNRETLELKFRID